jgi:fused signal recognition particle receptor
MLLIASLPPPPLLLLLLLQVLLAPGDTFRAAAAEQLAEWARRSGAKIGTFKEGGRPGGVLAAACNDAKQQKDVDVVICDTAGRLHTAYALMEELANCRCASGSGYSYEN